MARSSTFHPMQFEMKSMEPKLLSETKSFLEGSFIHTHIRYPLNIEKSEEFLSNEKILLIGNEGRSDPGFLCFLPRKPVQFLKCRLDSGFYLRLRVESSLFQSGTVFIATTHLNTITVQDCWMWQGDSLLTQPYSKRFSYVLKFLSSYIIQDPRLSGFEIQAAKQYPLDRFQDLVDSQEYASIDFIPEASKRRRFFYRLETRPNAPVPSKKTQPAKPKQVHPTQQQLPPSNFTGPLIAYAKNIQGLPDTFDLFSADKQHIGEAAVQEEEVSVALRCESQKSSTFLVQVVWNSFLDSFEILKLASPGSKALQASYFMKGLPKKQSAVVESPEVSGEPEDSDEEQDEQ
jgi:hypothetical protein